MRKRKPAVVLPPFEDYAKQLDLEKIAAAIAKVGEKAPLLPQYDFDDAKRLVWLAGETWVPSDIQSFRVSSIEEFFESPIRGVKDLGGVVVDNAFVPEYTDFISKNFVLDWKTVRSATITKEWEDRLVDSWQWKIYSAVSSAGLFIYRGLNRAGKTREVLLPVPESNGVTVHDYLSGVSVMREGLRNAMKWPRHMPFACNAYGRACPHYEICSEDKAPTKLIELKPFSYTQIERFLLCPERYRLGQLLEGGEDPEENEDSRFGSAVHRGLAELYSQVRTLFLGTNA